MQESLEVQLPPSATGPATADPTWRRTQRAVAAGELTIVRATAAPDDSPLEIPEHLEFEERCEWNKILAINPGLSFRHENLVVELVETRLARKHLMACLRSTDAKVVRAVQATTLREVIKRSENLEARLGQLPE